MEAVPARNETTSPVPPLLNPVSGRSNLLISGLVVALAAGAATVLFFFDPAQHGFYPQCILHRTTGLLCPGCGSLRSLHHLLHGEIESALRFNALVVLLAPVAVILGLRSWWVAHSPNPVRARLPQALIWCVLALVVVFGILRNTPIARAMGLVP